MEINKHISFFGTVSHKSMIFYKTIEDYGKSVVFVLGDLAGWLTGWLTGWLAGWLAGCLAGWLAGWLFGMARPTP